MGATPAVASREETAAETTYDAIIIGAGISGLHQLYRLRELGMKVRVFEAGTNVGGTWYWNRYPGARFDSESWSYGYSFSEELLQEWDWKEHFSPQPDNLEYLNLVADKFNLRRDMQFRSRVTAAHWNDAATQWTVTLESGETASARFLFTAIGILSAHTLPRIPGVESFRGPAYHTGRWPHTPVDFAGKRVGIIGTGATAIQAIPEIAKQAQHLTVFQRQAPAPRALVVMRRGDPAFELDVAAQIEFVGDVVEIAQRFRLARKVFGPVPFRQQLLGE